MSSLGAAPGSLGTADSRGSRGSRLGSVDSLGSWQGSIDLREPVVEGAPVPGLGLIPNELSLTLHNVHELSKDEPVPWELELIEEGPEATYGLARISVGILVVFCCILHGSLHQIPLHKVLELPGGL